MNCIELNLKIIELVIAASIPILIASFGYSLTKKMEDVKNESARNYLWENKWTELLFEKYKVYIDDIISLKCICEKSVKGCEGEKLPALIDEINLLNTRIYKEGLQIVVLSKTLFGVENDIADSITGLYSKISEIAENGQINSQQIIGDLINLIKSVERITKKKM